MAKQTGDVLVVVGYQALAVGSLRQAAQLIELLGGMTLVENVRGIGGSMEVVTPARTPVTMHTDVRVVTAIEAARLAAEKAGEKE